MKHRRVVDDCDHMSFVAGDRVMTSTPQRLHCVLVLLEKSVRIIGIVLAA
jgi:uncharacterized protein (DUF849 family)